MNPFNNAKPAIAAGIRLTIIACCVTLLAPRGTLAQLTVERIFSNEMTAVEPSVSFMPDGRSIVSLAPNGPWFDVWFERIGGRAERLIDGRTLAPTPEHPPVDIEQITWSADARRALVYSNSQRVWRLDTKGTYWVWDRATGRIVQVSKTAGLQQFAKFSPDGAQVAFVRDNDLWVADPFGGREMRITDDGSDDIINGATDWVYEEELDLRDGFRWSPDGSRIAYWRFDQSAIPEFTLLDELELYPHTSPVRYPKAGTANSIVELRIVDIASGRNIRIETGNDTTAYLARMEWAGPGALSIQRLNRRQNRIDMLLADASTGRVRQLFAETDSAWVDVDDDLIWVRRNRQFLWTSERDGFNHIYLFNRDGSVARQLTRGEWDVDAIAGVDENSGRVFFTSGQDNPRERQLHSVSLDGRAMRRISQEPGTHDITMAPGARYYVDSWSTAARPPVVRLHAADGRIIRTLADNASLSRQLDSLVIDAPEFFTFDTPDGIALNGWMIRPPDFDPTRRYPVLMYVYGGPGSQTVIDAWGGGRFLWHQLIARNGVIVASVDGRGTGARGRDFRKLTYLDLGARESADQINAARHLASLPFVDPARIGIWGWSYGGYMTTLSMINGNVFRAGIAVAPVTDWRLYDTIYTERFMRTPADNAAGYDRSSTIRNASRLDGRLLLVHGTGDDNVHFQNTLQLSNALQAAGKLFDTMVYANRTHSISGGNTSVHLFRTMTDWLLRHLVGSPSGSTR